MNLSKSYIRVETVINKYFERVLYKLSTKWTIVPGRLHLKARARGVKLLTTLFSYSIEHPRITTCANDKRVTHCLTHFCRSSEAIRKPLSRNKWMVWYKKSQNRAIGLDRLEQREVISGQLRLIVR